MRSRKQAKGAMAVKGVVAAVIIVLVAVGAVWLLNNWDNITTPISPRRSRCPTCGGSSTPTCWRMRP